MLTADAGGLAVARLGRAARRARWLARVGARLYVPSNPSFFIFERSIIMFFHNKSRLLLLSDCVCRARWGDETNGLTSSAQR